MIPTVLALIVAIGTLAVLAITAARDRRARRLATGRPFYDQQPNEIFTEAINACTGRSPVELQEVRNQ